jgi:pimeloyl-ACP methyl ester carboxylesterase
MVRMDVRTRNHVVVTGREDGPVVLHAHGFGCQNMWRLVVPALEAHFARATFLSDNRADLATVSVPTPVGAFVHAGIDGSELATLDATGHCPQLSAPRPTAEAIIAFAAGPS